MARPTQKVMLEVMSDSRGWPAGAVAGVLAPIVYVATVIAGAASISGYSHLNDPISSLTEVGRTDVAWIPYAFLLYNLMVGLFSAAALARAWHDTVWRATFLLLLLTAACGMLMWPLPQDPIGSPATLNGELHIALAAIESLSSIIILTLSTRQFRARGELWLTAFCAAALAIAIVFGGAAALTTANSWPLMGLFERLTIGAVEVWMLVIAIAVLQRPALLARCPPAT
jgi:uncharacterized membrane protein YhaH (DUF805 family)